MATATCKLMYNITIHMTGYGVRILLTLSMYKKSHMYIYIDIYHIYHLSYIHTPLKLNMVHLRFSAEVWRFRT